MNIGIDIDDTISNSYEYLFPWAQFYTIEQLGKEIKNVKRDEITYLYTKTFHDWTKEEEKEFFKEYYPKLIKEVKPKLFADIMIKKIKDLGHKVFIITARYKTDELDVEFEVRKWLKNNNIEYDELIIDAKNKLDIAINNKIDVFIDDSIKNCEQLYNGGIKTFMMDSIVNAYYENENIKRVYSWPHVFQEIRRIEEEN